MKKHGLQELGQLSPSQQQSYFQSKLLSSKGCDSVVLTEDERETSKSYPDDLSAFYKTMPFLEEGPL